MANDDVLHQRILNAGKAIGAVMMMSQTVGLPVDEECARRVLFTLCHMGSSLDDLVPERFRELA